jgi:hypothetical protein
MEIFKFNRDESNPSAPILFERGTTLKDLKSSMWVERYLDAGEFEIVAELSSNLRNTLPIGSFISHTNTAEVMVVENHEITNTDDGEPEIKITGRSFEVLLDNRVIGSNQTWPADGQPVSVYELASDPVWLQARMLINRHISTDPPPLGTINTFDAFRNVGVVVDPAVTTVAGDPPNEARPLSRGSLYKALLEVLNLANLGIRSLRPGSWSLLPSNQNTHLALVIHRGIDRSKEVTFSYSSGEVINPEYFWSVRKSKNAALVSGKWLEILVTGPETYYDRRTMFIDASDLDDASSVLPTGTARTNIIAAMRVIGRQALASQNEMSISKVEISKNTTRYRYRTDYNVGDLVSVEGNYNASAIMRVIEYVEIEDETGEHSYPTLAEI